LTSPFLLLLPQLFAAVDADPWLQQSTYILLTSDNGADVAPALTSQDRLVRLTVTNVVITQKSGQLS
jgi:hypothetical protein